jgi:putative ABC transport system permease protein
MLVLAVKMLLQNKPRLAASLAGIASAFFLTAAQVGLLLGWCDTVSAIIRHAGVDVWVVAEQTPAFDYGTPLPRERLYQVRSTEGVAWAEGMFMAWNFWQRPDGRRVQVELIGLDTDSVGGPWQMKTGDVRCVHQPDTAIVDELFLNTLGVTDVGDEAEMMGRRAVVGGVSRDVRTFTTAPFVFTSVKSAVRYDRRYRPDEITYVLVRCAPGSSPEQVRDAIARDVPGVEVLTTRDFTLRTVNYWMLQTGAGLTLVLTAVLGLVIGVIMIAQTLFAVTQDHLDHYATLLALGFRPRRLAAVVVVQSLGLSLGGVLAGSVLLLAGVWLTAGTNLRLETTPLSFVGLAAAALAGGGLASLLSVRRVLGLDPVTVFRV